MPRRSWLALMVLAGAASAFGVVRAAATGQEIATVALSIPILSVALLTLRYTVPRPARLTVDRLDEAGLTDLIFYIYPLQDDPERGEVQPGDYLLQLHVAVANLGDRKAVLSIIRIDGFHNSAGEIVHLPGAPHTIEGARWVQRMGWRGGQFHHENMSEPGPYVLDPDDVIVMRFRVRPGIDWSDRWTLDSLRAFCDPLSDPLCSAFGTVIWRRAGVVVTERFEVSLVVEQQDKYVRQVKDLTQDFTQIPDLPERPLPFG